MDASLPFESGAVDACCCCCCCRSCYHRFPFLLLLLLLLPLSLVLLLLLLLLLLRPPTANRVSRPATSQELHVVLSAAAPVAQPPAHGTGLQKKRAHNTTQTPNTHDQTTRGRATTKQHVSGVRGWGRRRGGGGQALAPNRSSQSVAGVLLKLDTTRRPLVDYVEPLSSYINGSYSTVQYVHTLTAAAPPIARLVAVRASPTLDRYPHMARTPTTTPMTIPSRSCPVLGAP